MKPNIFFKTPKAAGTSILKALEECDVYDPHTPTHKIQNNGFCHVRYYVGGDDTINEGLGCRENLTKKEWEGDFEKNAYLWTVVRNPYERIVSCWFDACYRGYFSKRHTFKDFVSFVHSVKCVNTIDEAMEAAQMSAILCDCAKPGVSAIHTNADGCDCYFGILSHALPWGHSWLMTNDTSASSQVLPKLWENSLPRNFDYIIRFERLCEDFDKVCKELEITASLPHVNRKPRKSKHYMTYYEGDETIVKLVTNIYEYEFFAFGYRFGD
jgi:hypothetical protein